VILHHVKSSGYETTLSTLPEGPRGFRVNLRRILFVLIALQPALSYSLTVDRGRPFGAGEILGFPGADYFAGDLSHELRVLDPLLARDPFQGWSSFSLSRANPFSFSPGSLLFEGLACPLPGMALEGVLPSGAGTVETHDFPASAWWGPSAAGGAIHLRAPLFDPDTPFIAGGWAGVPHRAGAHVRFPGDLGTLAGSFRMKDDRLDGEVDAWTVTGRCRRDWKGDTRLAGGAMDLKTLSGARWTSLYGEVRSGVGHFNEWSLKPYVQRAVHSALEARQGGIEARTLFNMAGFVESQLATGVERILWEGTDAAPARTRGFVQNTESFDALGIVMGDLALRGDFETHEAPRYSLAAGLQGHYGALGFHAGSERSEGGGEPSRFRQDRVGLRYLPGDSLDAGIHYAAGIAPWIGGFHGPAVHMDLSINDPLIPRARRLIVRTECQTLLTSLAARHNEAAVGLELTLDTGTLLIFREKAVEGEPPSWEAAAEQPLADGFFAEGRFARMREMLDSRIWTAGVRYEW